MLSACFCLSASAAQVILYCCISCGVSAQCPRRLSQVLYERSETACMDPGPRTAARSCSLVDGEMRHATKGGHKLGMDSPASLHDLMQHMHNSRKARVRRRCGCDSRQQDGQFMWFCGDCGKWLCCDHHAPHTHDQGGACPATNSNPPVQQQRSDKRRRACNAWSLAQPVLSAPVCLPATCAAVESCHAARAAARAAAVWQRRLRRAAAAAAWRLAGCAATAGQLLRSDPATAALLAAV